MLISKKNVEVNSSLDIGHDTFGHKLKLRIDGMTIILPVCKGTPEYDVMAGRLISASKKKWKPYKVSLEFQKKGKRHPYWKALIIRRKSDNKMLLRIDFEPRNKNTGAIRLELGPQHMAPREIDMLILWLAVRIGYNEFMTLLEGAWVTRVDVALDIYGCYLDDYVWGMKDASVFTGFKKKHGLPGVQLGSNRSPLSILCYEKIDAVGRKSKILRGKGGRVELEIGDFPYFLRLEARIKPGGKPGSKNHKYLLLADLKDMTYPFERLRIYPLNIQHMLDIALMYENAPERHTIAYSKKHSQKSPERYWNSDKGRRYLETCEVTLFTEEKIWSFWRESVVRQGAILADILEW
ncbi:hypothetical protein AAIJ15_002612 [Salmonella enterica]|nr:hypothetical protein [Salmonella enterica]